MSNKFLKILIVGNGGSGKTTLSLKLSSILNCRHVLHLDNIYWVDGWKKNMLENFEKHVHRFMQNKYWIIEGTPMHDIEARAKEANIIIFLDIKRITCITRLVKRAIKNAFVSSKRLEIYGPAKLFSLKAAKWIWNFNHSKREEINELLNTNNEKKIFYITNNHELENMLCDIKNSIGNSA